MFVLLALLTAGFFYLVMPGIGAFISRARWRSFRKNLTRSSLFPHLGVRPVVLSGSSQCGMYRAFGAVDAFQGDDRVWFRSEAMSFAVDMTGQSVFLLSDSGEDDASSLFGSGRLPDFMPRRIPWNRVFSLPEGTSAFVSGNVFIENGVKVFRGTDTDPLFILIYEGAANRILTRGIWFGRDKNEYWNFLTPGALILGGFTLMVISYLLFRDPLQRVPAIISLSLGLVPVSVFLPPGIILFFLYRWMWSHGRYYRAERDILLLPLRFFPTGADTRTNTAVLPDGEIFSVQRFFASGIGELPLGGHPEVWRSLILSRKKMNHLHTVFGAVSDDGTFHVPNDPFAGLQVIIGEPRALSKACAELAQVLEIIAVCFFGLGLGINYLITLIGLGILIR